MFNLEIEDYRSSKYRYIGEFHEGLARVQNYKGLWGFINKRGKEVIPCNFYDACDFSEGLVAVKNKLGLWGYINKKAELILPYKYIEASKFKERRAAVILKSKEHNTAAYIDTNGNELFTHENSIKLNLGKNYPKIPYDSNEGFGLINYYDNIDKCDKYTYLDFDVHAMFEDLLYATVFHDGIALCKKNYSSLEVIDIFLSKICELPTCDFDDFILGSNRFIVVRKNHKYGFGCINKDNKFEIKIPCLYTYASNFENGFAYVEIRDDIIGFVDENGRNMLFSNKTQYQDIRYFSEGLAAVKNIDGLWGFINKQGKEVIPCKFKEADDFSEGLAGVIDVDDNLYYIDKKGNIKLEFPIYCSILELNDKTLYITAESEQVFSNKKLQILRLIQEEYMKQFTNYINELAYQTPAVIDKPHNKTRKATIKRDRKNNDIV